MDLTSHSVRQITRNYFLYLMSVFDANALPTEMNIFRPAYIETIEFLGAGLTPAIFIDIVSDTIFVTTEEKIQNKMH